jgi:hypothetical protein
MENNNKLRDLTPMEEAFQKAYVEGGDQAIDRLINMANESRVPATDPMWKAFEEDQSKIREMQERIKRLEEVAKETKKPVRRISKINEVRKLETLLLVASFLGGIILSGIYSILFFLPGEIKTGVAAQRKIDAKNLEYLSSKDGAIFKKMLYKNKNYFPHQCEEEARKRKLSLYVNGKKTNKVCVLVLPD